MCIALSLEIVYDFAENRLIGKFQGSLLFVEDYHALEVRFPKPDRQFPDNRLVLDLEAGLHLLNTVNRGHNFSYKVILLVVV